MSTTDDSTNQQRQKENDEDFIQFYGGKLISSVPLVIFVIWSIVQTAVFQVSDTNGLVVGSVFSLLIGMVFVKGPIVPYANAIFEGMAQRVVATAIIALMWALMFANILQSGNFVQGLVWTALNINVGGSLFPAVTFILTAVFGLAVGTSFGTAVTFTTLFYPAGILLGSNPLLLFGAILSGAILGDHLAPVSDTTIVSAVTQSADIGGVVASRFKYVLLAVIPTVLLYALAGMVLPGVSIAGDTSKILAQNSNPIGLVHLCSLGIVIYLAIKGRHILVTISTGILVATILNIGLGLAKISDLFLLTIPENVWSSGFSTIIPFVTVGSSTGISGAIYSGVTGAFSTSILLLLILAMTQIMSNGGVFELILNWIVENVKTVKSAELAIVGSSAVLNSFFVVHTSAEIILGPYISQLGKRFNVNGYRRANLLDTPLAGVAAFFPWAGPVLLGYGVMSGTLVQDYSWFTKEIVVNTAYIAPFVFYGWFVLIAIIASALTGFGREYTTDDLPEEVSRI
ncbi:Na+/H+ antiporter NhaC family protein [Halococcus thailandensis]|uniref:Na+/H+ antiporter NhaC-like protein n=1 Tax=Halococcus thailandensis JCM 13552 TaxID=1227457 RepID=M0NGD3_9EURY|nr:Na+/H+ antiporter NhaC family protein [Halococcus thailandensis]EMA56603.1 Na+/H+ antiporter NhaC-like protein [Halococcus thailandensis JCM 13552]